MRPSLHGYGSPWGQGFASTGSTSAMGLLSWASDCLLATGGELRPRFRGASLLLLCASGTPSAALFRSVPPGTRGAATLLNSRIVASPVRRIDIVFGPPRAFASLTTSRQPRTAPLSRPTRAISPTCRSVPCQRHRRVGGSRVLSARPHFVLPEDSRILFEEGWMPIRAGLIKAFKGLYRVQGTGETVASRRRGRWRNRR